MISRLGAEIYYDFYLISILILTMNNKKRVISPKCYPKPNEPDFNLPKSASAVVEHNVGPEGLVKGNI